MKACMEINTAVLNSKRSELRTRFRQHRGYRKLLLMESLFWRELSQFSKEVCHKSLHVFNVVFQAAKIQC